MKESLYLICICFYTLFLIWAWLLFGYFDFCTSSSWPKSEIIIFKHVFRNYTGKIWSNQFLATVNRFFKKRCFMNFLKSVFSILVSDFKKESVNFHQDNSTVEWAWMRTCFLKKVIFKLKQMVNLFKVT